VKYPKVVQEKIDFLQKYEWNINLKEFNIFHLYPGEIAYPNGFHDSRFFNLVGFNTELMKKRDLGRHDSLDFWREKPNILFARVFADGAFLIKMNCLVEAESNTQTVYITGVTKR